jgi:hypothetical protein
VDRREALLLSSQAHRDLEAHRRLHDMRRTVALLAGSVPADLRGRPEVAAALAEASESAVTVVHMAQRPENEGIGMSLYDFSAAALRRRGEAGAQDMAEALRLIEETAPTLREPGFRIHKIGGDAG